MDAGVHALYPHDLVLHKQLATFQLRDLEVIGRRMSHRFGDFVLKGTVPPFQFRKMRLHCHMGRLHRIGLTPLTGKFCHEVRGKSIGAMRQIPINLVNAVARWLPDA